MEDDILLNRWRLVLGRYSSESLGNVESGSECERIGEVMEFLYDREYEGRDMVEGSMDDSRLTIPSWIEQVHQLFPKDIITKLENHALEKYHLTEMLTNEKVLARLQPNVALLKQILFLKRRMKGSVLEAARLIVAQTVEELKKNMEQEIVNAVTGRRDRTSSSPLHVSGNIDFQKTIRKNLKNYDVGAQQILIEHVYFNRNVKRINPWHIILCVDESGSMLENVIHAAVMAGIFSELPVLSTKLVIFDTNIVDLTGYVEDPVEALMSIQLGGGTDIGKALAYCESLITYPYRTIVVLISDLCDGAGYRSMYAHAAGIMDGGSKLLCLTSLDKDCEEMYDRTAAKKLAGIGAKVAALTPVQLAGFVGDVIGGSV